MTNSDTFERQIHRIHELLEGSGAAVTWNDHLPDPDNPKQPRQIDITIRRDRQLALIECRFHRSRQNVKWIEELIGRRVSLGADSVIAVSSSGFTEGAFKKAERFGIILRDFRGLTDDEILNWGRSVALTLFFYQYSDINLTLLFEKGSAAQLDSNKLRSELKAHPLWQSVFNAAADQLGTLNPVTNEIKGCVEFKVRLKPEALYISGEPVLEAEFTGNARVSVREVRCPVVRAYGSPELNVGQRDIVVEHFSLGETSIIHNGSRVSVVVDISMIDVPPLSQFRFARVSGKQEMDFEAFELLGVEKIGPTPGTIGIGIACST